MLHSLLTRIALAALYSAAPLSLIGGCMQESKKASIPASQEGRSEYQHVQGMLLYVALGGEQLKGEFPRVEKGELGPFDLDYLAQFLYAENGNVIAQRRLAFEMKQDAMKQNPWMVLRARFWLAQCGDGSTGKELENEVPSLFQRRVDLTKGMASVVWAKAELDGVRKRGFDALLGDQESAWRLYREFSAKASGKMGEVTTISKLSVMDQVSLLRRAPKWASREEMAIFWLLIAAENGHAEAQFELGSHWSIPDYFGTARSVFWLRKASKNGNEKASKWLEQLEQTNHPQYVRNLVEAWEKGLAGSR